MVADVWEMYLLAFVVVSIGNAFLSSWTPLFYRRKSWGQLTPNELRVKQGTATFEIRMNLFVRTFFSCFFSYQIYLVALFISGSAYLVMEYLIR